MKAIITLGLGFGDEGKGATVDYLTRTLGADLVVRYSGGAQAGHNVELASGRRHTFSQFGAGTLAGAKTYLGPRMIISPCAMVPEAEHLRVLGVGDPWSRLLVHPDCIVSTVYHRLMNRLREKSRGPECHGSCGLGIGESRNYWLRYGQDSVFAGDLMDRRTLITKLALLRDRLLIEMQELPRLDGEMSAMMYGRWPVDEAESLRLAAQEIVTAGRMPRCDTVIFEGAQGTLLDECKGLHPYTTWSTVTALHAFEMLAEFPDAETMVIGITRGYATRHGAGPFPTWCPKMSARMNDPGNPSNHWQGTIRFGPLDLVLTEYAARVSGIDGIFVNGLDQLPSQRRIAVAYHNHCNRLEEPDSQHQQRELTTLLESVVPVEHETSEEGMLELLAGIAPIVGVGRGASHTDRQLTSRLSANSQLPTRQPNCLRAAEIDNQPESIQRVLRCE